MAGSLIKINEAIVTSATPSVTLTGIDSTYDVYMVKVNNVQYDTDGVDLDVRVTVSGTNDSTANYDSAFKLLKTDTAFSNLSYTNQTEFFLEGSGSNVDTEPTNAILYLFNFNNSSEYCFGTVETTQLNSLSVLSGLQGGFVHTVAQSCDGLYFFPDSGNIDNGKFTLFGLKK